MIDLSHIEKYRENNRIEAKKALGGLPKSIWETYAAFANTLGGVILLGVEEYKDKTLHPVNLPNPEKLVGEFWNIINNPQKVSVNILADRHVTIHEVNGNHIIAITVPRAQRSDRPVFIEGNPMSGTYRRNGEGDYKCTREEVQAMMRDAAIQTQDMTVIEKMNLDVFDYETIHQYRIRMKKHRPGLRWEELEDAEFLYKLGAVGRSEDGQMHPTAAGLLLFGKAHEILKEYPNYFLDYQEQREEGAGWTDRITSSSGDWSGNLYDFYFRVYNKLVQGVEVPFRLADEEESDDTSVHSALREALGNCLVNADYYGKGGIVIVKKKNMITLSNPGGLRIDIKDVKGGGVSDPRNAALNKMFHFINIGEGAGSGISNIYKVWKEQGWKDPIILESFEPERITMIFRLEKDSTAKTAIKNIAHKNAIIEYLTRNVTAMNMEIAELLDMKPSHVKDLMEELLQEEIIVAERSDEKRIYKLKA